MADEGLMNLEDPAPGPPAAVPAPVAVVPEAPAVAPPEPEELDPESVDLADQGRVRALLGELSRTRGIVRELKPKAERATQLEQQVAQMLPTVQFVQQNPQLFQRQAAPAQVTPQAQAPDPEVVEWAQTFSLYKADGTLDLDTAAKSLSIADRRAERKAQTAVQPMRASAAQQASHANFQHVMANLKDADGNPPSQQHLQAVWNAVGVEATADLNVASMLGLMAIGADRTLKKSPIQPPVNPPVFTEPSGGTPRAKVTLSPLEENLAKERGKSAAQWGELTKGHQQNRPSVLEE